MSIGILGCGQLGYFLAQAAIDLGFDPIFVKESNESTKIVERLGVPIADVKDVTLSDFTAVIPEKDIVPLVSGNEVYDAGKDRLKEKLLLNSLDIPTTPFGLRPLYTFPQVVKNRKGGYDGKGQVILEKLGGINQKVPQPYDVIFEPKIDFMYEVSVVGAYNGKDFLFYPMTTNFHQKGVLRFSKTISLVGAMDQETEIQKWIERICLSTGYKGVLTIECFIDPHHNVIVNEIAPRVHNTGHWTMRSDIDSQFTTAIKAALGLPFGNAIPKGLGGMVNILGNVNHDRYIDPKDGEAYSYGKDSAPYRKLGHIVFNKPTVTELDDAMGRYV